MSIDFGIKYQWLYNLFTYLFFDFNSIMICRCEIWFPDLNLILKLTFKIINLIDKRQMAFDGFKLFKTKITWNKNMALNIVLLSAIYIYCLSLYTFRIDLLQRSVYSAIDLFCNWFIQQSVYFAIDLLQQIK